MKRKRKDDLLISKDGVSMSRKDFVKEMILSAIDDGHGEINLQFANGKLSSVSVAFKK